MRAAAWQMFRKAQKSGRMLTEMNLTTKQENLRLQDLQVLEMLLLHGRWIHQRKKSIHQRGTGSGSGRCKSGIKGRSSTLALPCPDLLGAPRWWMEGFMAMDGLGPNEGFGIGAG
jgi:hypothetical protein